MYVLEESKQRKGNTEALQSKYGSLQAAPGIISSTSTSRMVPLTKKITPKEYKKVTMR